MQHFQAPANLGQTAVAVSSFSSKREETAKLTMQIEAFLVSVTETVITPFSLSSQLTYQPLFSARVDILALSFCRFDQSTLFDTNGPQH